MLEWSRVSVVAPVAGARRGKEHFPVSASALLGRLDSERVESSCQHGDGGRQDPFPFHNQRQCDALQIVADPPCCTLVVLVSLLILRAPPVTKTSSRRPLSSQNKICDIRSIGSSKQCRRVRWRARWRGRCGVAASWSPRGTA